jgi:hypothetical protein
MRQKTYRIETHVPDVPHQALQAVDDVPRIETERFQDHPDQDRQQHQPEDHR